MKSAAKDLVVSKGVVTVRSLLEGPPIHGRGELEGSRRILFHRVGTRFFYDLAISLHLQKLDFDIRDYKMGDDTSGEIWLHTTRVFLQMSQDYLNKDPNAGPVKARRCYGIRDFPKNDAPITWMPMSAIDTVRAAHEWFLNYLATGQ